MTLPDGTDGTDSYPRESARTRSRHGTDTVNCLWVVDATTGDERLVADPAELLVGRADDDLPAEELARRERAR
jgi:dipeptidyl-peptidase-4